MRDEIPRKTSIEKTQGNLLSSAYNIQGRGLWLLPGPSLCPLNSRASEKVGSRHLGEYRQPTPRVGLRSAAIVSEWWLHHKMYQAGWQKRP